MLLAEVFIGFMALSGLFYLFRKDFLFRITLAFGLLFAINGFLVQSDTVHGSLLGLVALLIPLYVMWGIDED